MLHRNRPSDRVSHRTRGRPGDRCRHFRRSPQRVQLIAVRVRCGDRPGDITDQDDIDRIVAAAESKIDALANVAGVNDDFSPVHETSDAMWDRVIGINLTGAFKLSRAVLPIMLAAGRGSIVNVASEAGLRGNASGTAYTVSKHAVIGLTRSAAFMYGPQGIRVNAVAPGGVATAIPMPANPSEFGSGRLAAFLNLIPPVATAEQLAAPITFLLRRRRREHQRRHPAVRWRLVYSIANDNLKRYNKLGHMSWGGRGSLGELNPRDHQSVDRSW